MKHTPIKQLNDHDLKQYRRFLVKTKNLKLAKACSEELKFRQAFDEAMYSRSGTDD